MKCPVSPEGVGSMFIQNVGYGHIDNSSKLLLFYFKNLQSLYISKRCGLHVELAQL